jgi:hypothetical protein
MPDALLEKIRENITGDEPPEDYPEEESEQEGETTPEKKETQEETSTETPTSEEITTFDDFDKYFATLQETARQLNEIGNQAAIDALMSLAQEVGPDKAREILEEETKNISRLETRLRSLIPENDLEIQGEDIERQAAAIIENTREYIESGEEGTNPSYEKIIKIADTSITGLDEIGLDKTALLIAFTMSFRADNDFEGSIEQCTKYINFKMSTPKQEITQEIPKQENVEPEIAQVGPLTKNGIQDEIPADEKKIVSTTEESTQDEEPVFEDEYASGIEKILRGEPLS